MATLKAVAGALACTESSAAKISMAAAYQSDGYYAE
jgi:hypothetical protein